MVVFSAHVVGNSWYWFALEYTTGEGKPPPVILTRFYHNAFSIAPDKCYSSNKEKEKKNTPLGRMDRGREKKIVVLMLCVKAHRKTKRWVGSGSDN